MKLESSDRSMGRNTNEFGHTELLQSIIHEEEDIFDRILSTEETKYIPDASGFDPLQLIVILGKENLVSDASLERYKEYTEHNERLPGLFHLAVIHSSRVSFLKRLHRLGFDVNTQIPFNGQTALHLSVKSENLDIASVLLSFGADRSSMDKKGRTPLDLALEQNHQELITLLQGKQKPDETTTTPVNSSRTRHISISSVSTVYSFYSDTENFCSENEAELISHLQANTYEDITALGDDFPIMNERIKDTFPFVKEPITSWISAVHTGREKCSF